jgi:hypothetical protein
MLPSWQENAGQNCDIKIANRSFEKGRIFGNDSNNSKFDSGGN